ncbi:hypothetical protein AO365_0625 [Moraxella catarrhalis]|nr:hypothetical protein AO365_0625 [Moraxella catarrhalis]
MTDKYLSFILKLINVKSFGQFIEQCIYNRYSYAIFLCSYYAYYLKLSLQMFYLSRFLGW